MKYEPGNIIKYKDNYGPEKFYYGIVIEQHPSCVDILTESRSERILSLFLYPKNSATASKIERILTIEEFSSIIKNNKFCPDKQYLLTIAKLIKKN